MIEIFVHFVAGSKFQQTGMFEVSKADDEEKPNSSSTDDNAAQKLTAGPQSSSALRVTIPTELQGVAYIMVLCQKGKLLSYTYNMFKSRSRCYDGVPG